MTARLAALLLIGLLSGNAQAQALASPAPIADVIRDGDGDRVPDTVGQTLTVEGTVSTATDAFGETGPSFYLQDPTGGLAIELARSGSSSVRPGDRVRVSGTVFFGAGMSILRESQIDWLASGGAVPSPEPYDSENPERVEGRLVEVEGVLAAKSHLEVGTALSITLADQSLLVAFLYAEAAEAIDTSPYEVGDRIRVVGIAGQFDRVAPYDNSYQIYPRSARDLRRVGIPVEMYRRGVLVALGLLVLAIGWVALLQRQVRRRVAQLHVTEERYRKVIDLASDAIVIHDLNGENVEMNRAAREAIGCPPGQSPPPLMDVVDPGDHPHVHTHLAKLQQAGQARSEFRILSVDGSRHFEFDSQLIALDGETRILSLARDVEARLLYEQGLISAREQAEETARVKSSFLASMSHEIRTPLTAVIGFAELLRYEVADDQLDLVLAIEAGGTRLLNTLNSVLDLAQMDAGGQELRPQPVDLVEHIARSLDVLRPMAEGQGLALVYDAELATLPAAIDPGAFDRILTNLIGNAVKFTDDGQVTVSLRAHEGELVITVADTGIGIDAKFLPDLFSEFRQESEGHGRSHEGSGLGLAITQRLVELMDGRIEVASEKGVGTTFTVTLPHVLPAAAEGAMLVASDRQLDATPAESPSIGLADLLG